MIIGSLGYLRGKHRLWLPRGPTSVFPSQVHWHWSGLGVGSQNQFALRLRYLRRVLWLAADWSWGLHLHLGHGHPFTDERFFGGRWRSTRGLRTTRWAAVGPTSEGAGHDRVAIEAPVEMQPVPQILVEPLQHH